MFLDSCAVTTFRLLKGGFSRARSWKSVKKSKIQRAQPADAIQSLQTDTLKEYGFSISSSNRSCSTCLVVPEMLEGCQSMHRRRFVCKQNKQSLLNSCSQLSNNSPLRIQHHPAAYLILNSCFLSWLSIFKSSTSFQKQKTNKCQFSRHPG